MEIERKYKIENPGALPFQLSDFPFHELEQGYLCTDPVVRIRRFDAEYTLTYKSKGLLEREEYNLPLTREAYLHLRKKTDGLLIEKRRYLIPLSDGLTAELDVFSGPLAPLVLAEVEFSSKEDALRFVAPSWFGEDVTFSSSYHNSTLSRYGLPPH